MLHRLAQRKGAELAPHGGRPTTRRKESLNAWLQCLRLDQWPAASSRPWTGGPPMTSPEAKLARKPSSQILPRNRRSLNASECGSPSVFTKLSPTHKCLGILGLKSPSVNHPR